MQAADGQVERRVGLGRAFEALFESARVLARPGTALLAGFLFPVFSFALAAPAQDGLSGLALELRQSLAALQPPSGEGPLHSGGAVRLSVTRVAAVAAFLYLSAGVSAGLARHLARSRGGAGSLPRFGALWRAGAGLRRPAFGILVARVLLPAAVLWAAQAPAALLARGPAAVPGWLAIALVAGPVVVALLYALLVEVVAQLALQSLVANERGVVSALEHAWRLVRASPWDAARAALPYVVLLATTGALLPTLRAGLGGALLARLAEGLLACGIGLVAAGHWARAYELLGGMRTVRTPRAPAPAPAAPAGA